MPASYDLEGPQDDQVGEGGQDLPRISRETSGRSSAGSHLLPIASLVVRGRVLLPSTTGRCRCSLVATSVTAIVLSIVLSEASREIGFHLCRLLLASDLGVAHLATVGTLDTAVC